MTKFPVVMAVLLANIFANANPVVIDSKNNFDKSQEYLFPGPIYTILNHASEYWDSKFLSKNGVDQVVDFSKIHNVPVIATFNSGEPSSGRQPFYNLQDVNFIAQSQGGENSFRFPVGKTFIIAGAYLSECICQMLSDVLNAGIGITSTGVRVILVTDAIVDHSEYWKPAPLTSDGIHNLTVDRILKSESSMDLIDYVQSHVFQTLTNNREIFCPRKLPKIEAIQARSFNDLSPFKLEDLIVDESTAQQTSHTIHIFKGQEEVGKIGGGPVSVDLIFAPAKDLGSIIHF